MTSDVFALIILYRIIVVTQFHILSWNVSFLYCVATTNLHNDETDLQCSASRALKYWCHALISHSHISTCHALTKHLLYTSASINISAWWKCDWDKSHHLVLAVNHMQMSFISHTWPVEQGDIALEEMPYHIDLTAKGVKIPHILIHYFLVYGNKKELWVFLFPGSSSCLCCSWALPSE